MPPMRLINLSWILDLNNYLLSLERWLSIFQKHQANPVEEQRYFNLYIKIVKPHIHRYHTIISTLTEDKYGFYSDMLHKQQIKILREVFKGLSRYEILEAKDVKKAEKQNKYEFLSQETFKELLKNPTTNLSSVPLKEKPKNEQFRYWDSYVKVDEVEISSVVIHGKGLAKKELGFPTANLEVNEAAQQTLKQHPNGVYLVEFKFLNGKKYLGVCCIGTNPHYENLKYKRLIEVYIYHEFDEDFYDAEVSMKLLALLRFEGKFETFDAFLNAMHNDIEMGKNIAEKLKLSL